MTPAHHAPTMTRTAEDDPAPGSGGETVERWFGPADRPLFGVLHRPAGGQARGGVVLCPPLATELNFSYWLLRTLAVRLAALGLLVVRFDYDGTGQSAGDTNDPERVPAYIQSINAAVTLAHAEGAEWVAGVGLRLGATLLAAAVHAGTELDALTLWDPCLSGRGFLREQRALLGTTGSSVRASAGGSADRSAGTEIAGYLYSPQTSAELEALELPGALPTLSADALVLLDSDRPGAARIRRRLADPAVHWDEYRLPSTIFDTGLLTYDLPEPALAPVLSWVDSHAPERRRPLLAGTVAGSGSHAVVATAEDGSPIEERLLRIGGGRLFAIETRAATSDLTRPVVVLLSIAAEPSIGPGRMWVDLARRWAQRGFRCVRVDLSGIGESDPRPGELERVIYSPTVLEDVREACAVAEGTPGAVLVGLCSGAYAILKTAPHLRLAGAIAVNPYLTLRELEHWWSPEPADPRHESPPGLAERIRGAGRAGLRRLAATISRVGRNVEWRERLLDRFPAAVWFALVRLGLAFSPATLIEPVIDAGVPLLLVCGDVEGGQARMRSARAFRRLSEAPQSGFAFVPDLDHSLRVVASRRDATTRMTEFITTLAPAPAPAPDIAAVSRQPVAAAPTPRDPLTVG